MEAAGLLDRRVLEVRAAMARFRALEHGCLDLFLADAAATFRLVSRSGARMMGHSQGNREWDTMIGSASPIRKPSTSEIIKKAVGVLTDLGFSSIQVTDGSVSLVINAALQK